MDYKKLKEVKVAAKWWSKNICLNNQDTGDLILNTFMREFHCAPNLTDEKRKSFEEALIDRITERYNYLEKKLGIKWDSENPSFGSAHRTLSVDYAADKILTNAAKDVGIKITNGTFPCKTTMWVMPGKVKVSHGYRSPIEIIYIKLIR